MSYDINHDFDALFWGPPLLAMVTQLSAKIHARQDPDNFKFPIITRDHEVQLLIRASSLNVEEYVWPIRAYTGRKLHSWASGLTEFGDRRNQESVSEGLNAYDGAALLARALGDRDMADFAATCPSLAQDGVLDGWRGFFYPLEDVLDPEAAIAVLKAYDDGNSLTNLLWWIHSRI